MTYKTKRKTSKRPSRKKYVTNANLTKIFASIGVIAILSVAGYKGYLDGKSSIDNHNNKLVVERSDVAIDDGPRWSRWLGDCAEGIVNPSAAIKFQYKDVGGKGDCLYLCLVAATRMFDNDVTPGLNMLKRNLQDFVVYLPDITPTGVKIKPIQESDPFYSCQIRYPNSVPNINSLLKARYLRSLVVNSSQFMIQDVGGAKKQLQDLLKDPYRVYDLYQRFNENAVETVHPYLSMEVIKLIKVNCVKEMNMYHIFPQMYGMTHPDLRYILFQVCIHDLINQFGTEFGDKTPDSYNINSFGPDGKLLYLNALQLQDSDEFGELPFYNNRNLLNAIRPMLLESFLEKSEDYGRFGTSFNIETFEIMASVSIFIIQSTGKWAPSTAEVANRSYINLQHYNLIEVEQRIANEGTQTDLIRDRDELQSRIDKIDIQIKKVRSRPLIILHHLNGAHFQLAGLVTRTRSETSPKIRTVFGEHIYFEFQSNGEWTAPQTVYEFLGSDNSLCS